LSGLGINCISFITDWEARFRILVAIGTIITLAKEYFSFIKIRTYAKMKGEGIVLICLAESSEFI
jgi:hypothetical protein